MVFRLNDVCTLRTQTYRYHIAIGNTLFYKYAGYVVEFPCLTFGKTFYLQDSALYRCRYLFDWISKTGRD